MIVGGMLLSPICSLMVIPVFARLFTGRDARVREGDPVPEENKAPA
ncbi:MAG: hypothetical protein WDO17_05410 [Alphaproteobacteria bacterium]